MSFAMTLAFVQKLAFRRSIIKKRLRYGTKSIWKSLNQYYLFINPWTFYVTSFKSALVVAPDKTDDARFVGALLIDIRDTYYGDSWRTRESLNNYKLVSHNDWIFLDIHEHSLIWGWVRV